MNSSKIIASDPQNTPNSLVPEPEIPKTIFLKACEENDLESIEKLLCEEILELNYGFFEIIKNSTDIAISIQCLNSLLEHGGNINFISNGISPLLCAAENGYMKIVEWLLEKGADFKQKDKDKNTILHILAKNNTEQALDCVKLLIKYDINLNEKNNLGNTPLNEAAIKGNGEMYALLESLNNSAIENPVSDSLKVFL